MKEKINSLQFTNTFILCILSSSIGLSLYTTIKIAGHDSYIGVLIGSLLGLIPLLVFMYILSYEKDLPLYDKTICIFGKVLGNIINIIITLLYFTMGITILFNLGNFIVSQYLSNTPLLLVIVIFSILVYYITNKGFEVITRVSSIFIIIVIVFFLFSFIYLFQEFKVDNLKPILEFGFKSPLLGGFINMLITTSPIYTLLIFPKNNLVDKEKVNKYLCIGYIVAVSIIFLISLLSNGILGKYLVKLYQYPGYTSLKKISLFGFIDRIENFMSLHWIVSTFISLAMIVYFIKSNIKRQGNSKILNFIIVIIITFGAYKAFSSNTSFNNYTYKIYPYFLSILTLLFILIAITIFIKRCIKKTK